MPLGGSRRFLSAASGTSQRKEKSEPVIDDCPTSLSDLNDLRSMQKVIANVPFLRSSYCRLSRQFRQEEVFGSNQNLNRDACISTMFRYHKQVLLSLRIMAKIAKSKYPISLMEEAGKIYSITNILAARDLTRVVYPIAAAAWLTTDHFRWHQLEEYKAVPEDLSYGLVLQYFEPVVESTRYFLSPTGRQRHRLSQKDWVDARASAVNLIQNHHAPNATEAAISWQLLGDSWR